MTTERVFEKFVEKYTGAAGSFRVFTLIESIDLENRPPGLATWAVDWTLRPKNPRRQDLTQAGFSFELLENAHSDDNEQRYHFDHGVFCTGARVVTSIQILSEVFDSASYSSPFGGETKTISSVDAAQWLKVESMWPRELSKKVSDLLYEERVELARSDNSLVKYLVESIRISRGLAGSILDGRRLACLQSGCLALVA
jgi:hypothetical protein